MHLVVVIGTPVDEFLGPSMTIFEKAVDQIAPHLRDGRAGRPAQHRLPGHDRLRRPAPRRARLHASTSPSAPSGSPRATRSRSSTRCRRSSAPTTIGPPSARRELFGKLASKTIRTTTKEAELAKLFTNTWRYMKFAVANQFFTIAHEAGVDYTNILRAIREDYPRAADLPGPGLRRRSVPVQGHDAAVGLHDRPLPARPGRDAGQRGAARLHRVGPRAPLRRADRQDGRASSGWPSRPSRDDPRASLSYKLRKLLSWAGARVLAPIRTSRTTVW